MCATMKRNHPSQGQGRGMPTGEEEAAPGRARPQAEIDDIRQSGQSVMNAGTGN